MNIRQKQNGNVHNTSVFTFIIIIIIFFYELLTNLSLVLWKNIKYHSKHDLFCIMVVYLPCWLAFIYIYIFFVF